MAQYDGSIRINTQINTKNVSAQMMSLENRIAKTADKIAALHSKMDNLKSAQIPTQEYKEIADQITKAEAEFNKLLEKQEQMQREGKDHGVAWDRLNERMEEAGNTIRYAQGELQDLVDTGRAFTLGSETQEYANLGQQLQYAENDLEILNQRHTELEQRQANNTAKYRQLGSAAKAALDSVGKVLKKVNSLTDSFGKRIKQAFLNFAKSSDSANKNAITTSRILKSILKYGLGIRSLYALINKLRTAIKGGFSNLYNDKSMTAFKNQVDSLKASLLTLKNSFAAAFRPLVEAAIPYIQRVIDYMIRLLNVVGQFMAAITGQKSYTRAIRQTTAAIEDQNKAQNKQLSNLDNLNNLTSNNGGGSGGAGTEDMFEEVPINDRWINLAEKIKDIGKDFFNPIKAAWDRVGKKVMDSWKYALDEVWKLVKDIGRDFLKVWNQEATISIFEDILAIIADIGLVIGNLARQFRLAWNENEIGLKIFQNIRDIIGIIIGHIKNAADATVEWSANLNFYPILDAFNYFLESFKPAVDALSGILEDFYTKVLLPLGKWTIEEGLPKLLDVFTAFNNKVDWEALRENLAEFWEHLEPFAEKVGEGLILFIEDVSTALANFINSQEFKNFLVTIENWMDSVTPEDVATALKNIAVGLIALKVALLGFNAISAITGVLTTIKTFLSFFGAGGGATAASSGMLGSAEAVSGLSIAISGLKIALAAVAAAVVGWNIGSWIAEKLELDPKPFNETMEEIKNSFTDGSWKGALKLWGDDIYNAFITLGERQDEKFNEIKDKISETWDLIKESASEKWSDIKENLSEKWENVKTDASTIFSELKTSLSNIWDEVSSTVSEKWDAIKSTISGVVDEVQGKIEGFIDKIKSAIQSVKDFLSSGFDKIGSAISGVFSGGGGGTSTYSSASPYSAMPQMAALSNMEFPGYATGQVIPTSMKKHLAWLGDNPKETEVVSPLSTIKQANKEAVLEVLSELGISRGNGNRSGGETFVFQVDGKTFFEITREEAKRYFSRTGRSPYPI